MRNSYNKPELKSLYYDKEVEKVTITWLASNTLTVYESSITVASIKVEKI